MFKNLDEKKPQVFDDNGPIKFYLDFDFEFDYVHYRWDEEIKKYGGITVDKPDENTIHIVLNPIQRLKPFPWDIYDSLFIIDSMRQKKIQELDKYKVKAKICFGPIMFRSHRNELAKENGMLAQKKIKVGEKIIGIIGHDPTAIRPDIFYSVDVPDNMLNPLVDCDNEDEMECYKSFKSVGKNFDKELQTSSELFGSESSPLTSPERPLFSYEDEMFSVNASNDDEATEPQEISAEASPNSSEVSSKKEIESTTQQDDLSHESDSDDEWIQSSQIVDAVKQKEPEGGGKLIDKNENNCAENGEQKKLNKKNEINKINSPINCGTLKKKTSLAVFLANSQDCTRDDGEKDLIMHDKKINKQKLSKNCERNYSENDEKNSPESDKQKLRKKVEQKSPDKVVKQKSLEKIKEKISEKVNQKVPEKIKQKTPEKIRKKSTKIIEENIKSYSKPGPLSSKQKPRKLFGVKCREIPYPLSSDEELENISSNDESKIQINKENSKVSKNKKRPSFSDAESSTEESPPPRKIRRVISPKKPTTEKSSSNDEIETKKIKQKNSKVSNKKQIYISDVEKGSEEATPPKNLRRVIPTRKLPRPQTEEEEEELSSNDEIETKKIKQKNSKVSNKKQLSFSDVESGSEEATPPKKLHRVIPSKKNKKPQTEEEEEEESSNDENKRYESPRKIRRIDFNKPSTSGKLSSIEDRNSDNKVLSKNTRKVDKSREIMSPKNSNRLVVINDSSSSGDEREEQVNEKLKKALAPPKKNISEKQLAGPSVSSKKIDDIRVVTVNGRKIEIPSSLKKPYPRTWVVGAKLYFRSDLDPRDFQSSAKNKFRFLEWEQDAMIRFVCEKRYFHRTGSRQMWAEMIQTRPGDLCEHRTESALKEHWKRVLMNQIHEFGLPQRLVDLILNKKIVNR